MHISHELAADMTMKNADDMQVSHYVHSVNMITMFPIQTPSQFDQHHLQLIPVFIIVTWKK
jgi:hypothetical protein